MEPNHPTVPEQLRACQQREARRWNRSRAPWAGEGLSHPKGLHHEAAALFLLRTAPAFPGTVCVSVLQLAEKDRGLNTHTAPGPAQPVFKLKLDRRFISFNGTVKNSKLSTFPSAFLNQAPSKELVINKGTGGRT